MALGLKYRYSELVVFGSNENTKTINLPQTVVDNKTIVQVMTNNFGNDSTYGGSIGNALITAELHSSGTYITVQRNYNYQQSMECKVELFEYTSGSGILVERGNEVLDDPSGLDSVLLSNPWVSGKTFSYVQMRGNPAWVSDMRYYTTYARGNPSDSNYLDLYHYAVSTSIVCHWQVVVVTDTDYQVQEVQELSSIVNGTRFLSITSVDADRTYSLMSLFGDGSTPAQNGRDFPMGSLQGSGAVFLYECAAFVNTTWYTSLELVQVAPTSSVQRQVVSQSIKTDTYTLSTPVTISNSIPHIVGQYDSWGAPNTYEEETGDFMFRIDLVDRGDGVAEQFELTRGESTSSPSAKVSVEIITYTPVVVDDIIKESVHILKMKTINNQ